MAIRPKLHRINPDIKEAMIYLRSTKKWGKSTLFRDTILEKYGDPERGLMICVGAEPADTLLDEINSVSVNNWKELMELVEWLIEAKGKEHNIEIVAFDTADELVNLAEAETVRIARKQDPTKNIRSIKAAFGGYNAGVKYAANSLIKPLMKQMKSGGFGVWALAHTKYRNTKDKGGLDEDGYMLITSNLDNDYESAFGDIFDIVLTGVVEREFDTKVETINKKDIVKKYVTSTENRLYLRGNMNIDAGGRLAYGSVPEYMVFDFEKNNAKEFIEIIEKGMELSKCKYKKQAPAYKTEAVKVVEEVVEGEDDQDDITEDDIQIEEAEEPVMTVAEFKELYKNCKDADLKASIRDELKEVGITSFAKMEEDDIIKYGEMLKNA